MSTPAVSGRYVTADFRQSPLLALADLMGLSNYQAQLAKAPELYAPILNGIAVYRTCPRKNAPQSTRRLSTISLVTV